MVLGFFSQNLNAQSPEITVTNGWLKDLRNEITEAGSDYNRRYNSGGNQTRISLTNLGSTNWSVGVRYSVFGNWPSGSNAIRLRARRRNGGTGTVSGGTAWQNLTTVDTEFFTGSGNASNLRIQYQLRDISVLIPLMSANTLFRVRVLYTLTTP